MRRRTNRAAILGVLGVGLVLVACGGGRGEASAPRAEEGPAASPAGLAAAEFDVEGMTCGGCALATEIAVKKLEGVVAAEASYDEETGGGRASIRYDPAVVTTEALMAAIREVGFEPTLIAASGAK